MTDTPSLSDGTVVLDAFTFDDVAEHLAGEDEEHARRFGWHPGRSTETTVRSAISNWIDDWKNDGLTRAFAARDADDGKLIGGCQLRFKGEEVAQLSYWVFPGYRRQGNGARIVALACRFAFSSLGIERIEALVEPDNEASRVVLRHNRFVEEGLLRNRGRFTDGRHDMVLYSLLPSDL
jgi:RimJ/RimL family protein N-acetyltransferase